MNSWFGPIKKYVDTRIQADKEAPKRNIGWFRNNIDKNPYAIKLRKPDHNNIVLYDYRALAESILPVDIDRSKRGNVETIGNEILRLTAEATIEKIDCETIADAKRAYYDLVVYFWISDGSRE